MIRIERIRMRLPAGFEHRAQGIARRLGEILCRHSVARDASIRSISVTPQRIPRNISDEDIAQLIANEIIAIYPGVQQ